MTQEVISDSLTAQNKIKTIRFKKKIAYSLIVTLVF